LFVSTSWAQWSASKMRRGLSLAPKYTPSIQAQWPAVVIVGRLPISWSQSPASGKWVRAELRRLVQRRPEDVAHAIAPGTTTFVSGRIEEIFSTLLITFLLVVVVFLFLQPAAPS
jgi:hypothetical protein